MDVLYPLQRYHFLLIKDGFLKCDLEAICVHQLLSPNAFIDVGGMP